MIPRFEDIQCDLIIFPSGGKKKRGEREEKRRGACDPDLYDGDKGVESVGGAFSVVISGINVAIGVITVDGEDNRGGDGLGSPESLSDGQWLANGDHFGDAMDFNVNVDNLLLGSGPGAFDSVSSGDGMGDLSAGEVLDIEGWIHSGVSGERGEDRDARVK